jgi:hypothetical protein
MLCIASYRLMPRKVLRIVETDAGECRFLGFSVLAGCHVSVELDSNAGAVSWARFFFSFSIHVLGMVAIF